MNDTVPGPVPATPVPPTDTTNALPGSPALHRVVVVDDETGHRERLESLDTGSFTVTASYATVEELIAARPEADLVVLDLWLRGRTRPLRGLPAVQTLHSLGYRILLHSMDERPHVLARLIAAGANGFVSKAAPTSELIMAIADVSRGSERILTTQIAGFADQMQHLGLLKLTDSETSVLRARAQGMPMKAIATSTHYSEKALERHITNLNRKIKDLLRDVDIDGLDASADRPAAHVIARYLGYGPDDLL